MVVGCWLVLVGCWLLVVGGCWLLVVGCWLLVVGCWLLVVVVGCWLLVVQPTSKHDMGDAGLGYLCLQVDDMLQILVEVVLLVLCWVGED